MSDQIQLQMATEQQLLEEFEKRILIPNCPIEKIEVTYLSFPDQKHILMKLH